MIYVKRTATKSLNKQGTIYAIGRVDALEGKDKALGGYEIWGLAKNYDSRAKDGIAKSWRLVEDALTYAQAVAKFNKLVKWKAILP